MKITVAVSLPIIVDVDSTLYIGARSETESWSWTAQLFGQRLNSDRGFRSRNAAERDARKFVRNWSKTARREAQDKIDDGGMQ